jgi:hypothetical protein
LQAAASSSGSGIGSSNGQALALPNSSSSGVGQKRSRLGSSGSGIPAANGNPGSNGDSGPHMLPPRYPPSKSSKPKSSSGSLWKALLKHLHRRSSSSNGSSSSAAAGSDAAHQAPVLGLLPGLGNSVAAADSGTPQQMPVLGSLHGPFNSASAAGSGTPQQVAMFGLLPVFDNSAAAASSAAQQAPMQQQQRALHAVQSLPLTTGMNVQQPQQQQAWLPYQLRPLAPQQQQQQQLQAADIIPVKTLPLGMRVCGMSPQQRLQLRTDLLNGRQERMQQLQQQQQHGAVAAAVGEGEPAAKQPKTGLYGPAAAAAAAPNAAGNAQLAADYQARVNREVQQLMRSRLVGEGEPAAKQPKTGLQDRRGQANNAAQPQQQQQQLSASQVQMLQATLRKRQQELAQQQQQQQQQHGFAPRIRLLAPTAATAGNGTLYQAPMLGLPHAFGSSAAAAGYAPNQAPIPGLLHHAHLGGLNSSAAAASREDYQARVNRQVQELMRSRAVGEGESAAKRPKTGMQKRHGQANKKAQQQQQQLYVPQVQMLQASLRKRQLELTQQQQQQQQQQRHASAPRIGLLAAAAAAGNGTLHQAPMLGLLHAFGSSAAAAVDGPNHAATPGLLHHADLGGLGSSAAAASRADYQARVNRELQELMASRMMGSRAASGSSIAATCSAEQFAQQVTRIMVQPGYGEEDGGSAPASPGSEPSSSVAAPSSSAMLASMRGGPVLDARLQAYRLNRLNHLDTPAAVAAAVEVEDVHPAAVVLAQHAAAAVAVANVHPAAAGPAIVPPAAAAEAPPAIAPAVAAAPDAAGNAPLAGHDAVVSAAEQQVLDYAAELRELLCAAGQAPLDG